MKRHLRASISISLRNLRLLYPILLLLTSCTSQNPFSFPLSSKPSLIDVSEESAITIPLKGPVSRRRAQLSGLAWYGDNLILLPQYPDRFQNQLFYLTKLEIIGSLRADTNEPLKPHPIPLLTGDLIAQVPGFQGFEAIAIDGERVFLTIEAKEDEQMVGYLVTGDLEPDLSELRLSSAVVSRITPQTNLSNVTDEALLLAGDKVVSIYEVNGSLINLSPVAHVFSTDGLQLLDTMPFPPIDYRITDSTSLDEANRFWAINNFTLPNNPLKLGTETLAAKYGVGPSHETSQAVERLVEFQYTPDGITLVDTPPVQLRLLADAARNWEGIVRLEDAEFSGFLLVTDRQPSTILAFVPHLFQ